MATDVLVFVPGTLGSELWDGDDKVWPGTVWEAIKGFSDERFEQLRSPDLVPRDIVRTAAGGLIAVYSKWISAFESIARDGKRIFVENPDGGKPKTLYTFPYDWRVDLTASAVQLADFLDSIVDKTADVELKLVCHSMGGVLARYYLESGAFTGRPGFQHLSLFVTLGTPHNGAPIAYAAATGLDKTTFLSTDQTKTLANDTRYPSLYQLFPDKTHSFVWSRDPKLFSRDYAADDPDIVKAYGLTATGLKAWTTLRAGLTGNRPEHVRYFLVVGSRQETLTRLLWDGAVLNRIELEDAGDGTVSLPGALVADTQTEFVGKSHVSLIETRPARETLATLFGADTLFAASELTPHYTLTVRDLSVSTEDEIHLQIEFIPELDQFRGELAFERAVLPESGDAEPLTFVGAGVPAIPVELIGAAFTYATLKAAPIEYPGIYRPVLAEDGKERVAGPSFAVQAID